MDHVPLNIGRILTRRNGCLVSTTELLRCHAFTECLLLVMLPKGIRIETFCTPKRHFQVVLRIPIRSPKEELSHGHVSPLTSLGDNPTQHLDHSWADGNGKTTLVGEDSQAEGTSSLQRGLHDSVAPSSPTEPEDLKREGAKAPQPVAVDGCGDTALLSGAGALLASPGVARAAWKGSAKDPALADSPGTEGSVKLPQPVAVDGCGGPPPPFANDHCDPLPVTPTVAWTEKPVIPWKEPPSQVKDVLPQSTEGVATGIRLSRQQGEDSKSEDITAAISTATGPNLKQGGVCLLNDKEQPADGKPWVSALSTSEILAPIPEVDSYLASGEAAGTSSDTSKPKALPLSVSQTVRQGLAKVAAPKTLQKQTQSHLGGYVHGLTVTTDPALPKPLVQKTTSTSDRALGNWNTAQQVFSEGQPHWDNQRDELESRPIKGILRRSRSAGQSPLTPGRRSGTSGNSKSCPPARLKSSPIKDVMKHGGKLRKDQTPGFEIAKGDNGVLKNKHSGLPRAKSWYGYFVKVGLLQETQWMARASSQRYSGGWKSWRRCSYDWCGKDYCSWWNTQASRCCWAN